MPLVGGANLHSTASGDPADLRYNRPYRASPTGLELAESPLPMPLPMVRFLNLLSTCLRPYYAYLME
eukprot:6184607-Pleurochrysis_carterae.AAC.2